MELVAAINGFSWGLLVDWVCFAAVFLTLGLDFAPWRLIPYGIRALWHSLRHPRAGATAPGASQPDGELSSWRALMVVLGGTVGVGNLTGTALAVSLGGPGSLAWMWVISLLAMTIKFAETALAVRFRRRQADGTLLAGPMVTIQRGLSRRWRWLGGFYAAMAVLAGFGSANSVQVQQLANAMAQETGSPRLLTGLVVALLIAAVISGGLQRVGRVSAVLVPAMVLGYGGAVAVLLASHGAALIAALETIVGEALNPAALLSGGLAATVATAVRLTVFSTGAGKGNLTVVQGAAWPKDPVLQGSIAMLGNLIDTLLCSATGLLVVASGAHLQGGTAFAVLSNAIRWANPGALWISDVAVVVFSFTTILSFAVVGERCLLFLLGSRWRLAYRSSWCVAIVAFSPLDARSFWQLAEMLDALMVLPNLFSLLLLSPLLFPWIRSSLGDLGRRPLTPPAASP